MKAALLAKGFHISLGSVGTERTNFEMLTKVANITRTRAHPRWVRFFRVTWWIHHLARKVRRVSGMTKFASGDPRVDEILTLLESFLVRGGAPSSLAEASFPAPWASEEEFLPNMDCDLWARAGDGAA